MYTTNEIIKMHTDIVRIQFFIYGNNLTFDMSKKWIESMSATEPKKMSGSFTDYNTRNYNKEKLYKGLLKDMEIGHGGVNLHEDVNSMYSIYLKFNRTASILEANWKKDYYENNKESLLQTLDCLFKEFNCMVGYVTIYFDDVCIQNPYWKKDYVRYGLDLSKVNIIPSDLPGFHDDTIDIQTLPGHADKYNSIVFKSCFGMWFGPDFYRFFSEDKIRRFSDCYENKDLGDSFRRIFLYENIDEYEKEDNRRKQWEFRRHIQMEPIAHELISKPFIPKNEQSKPDPEIQFNFGSFDHGGDFIAKHYFDINEKPTVCSRAIGYYYIEYKECKQIHKG